MTSSFNEYRDSMFRSISDTAEVVATPHEKTVPLLREEQALVRSPERGLTLFSRLPTLLSVGVTALALFMILESIGVPLPLIALNEGIQLSLNITETRLENVARGILQPIGKVSATVFCATSPNDVECSRVGPGKF